MSNGEWPLEAALITPLLIPLLLMVGLSVDVGSWYNRSSDIQKAADAAALAAGGVDRTTWSVSITGDPVHLVEETD